MIRYWRAVHTINKQMQTKLNFVMSNLTTVCSNYISGDYSSLESVDREDQRGFAKPGSQWRNGTNQQAFPEHDWTFTDETGIFWSRWSLLRRLGALNTSLKFCSYCCWCRSIRLVHNELSWLKHSKWRPHKEISKVVPIVFLPGRTDWDGSELKQRTGGQTDCFEHTASVCGDPLPVEPDLQIGVQVSVDSCRYCICWVFLCKASSRILGIVKQKFWTNFVGHEWLSFSFLHTRVQTFLLLGFSELSSAPPPAQWNSNWPKSGVSVPPPPLEVNC